MHVTKGVIKKNRLTIGKFSTIDTSNSSREMDAKKLHLYIYEFSNIGPTCSTWTWRIKVKVKNCVIWHALSFKMILYMLRLNLWLERRVHG